MSELRVLSLGWGVQSWTLAAMAALGDIPPVDFGIFADTTWEADGTYAHAREWTPWLGERGLRVVTVMGKRTAAVYDDGPAVLIPAFTTGRGQLLRQCTTAWKIRPIREFIRGEMEVRGIRRTPGVVDSLLGISLDEFSRMRDSDVAYIDNSYPLVDLRMTRADCVGWLQRHDLPVPPRSTCVFCPYSSVASWKARKQAGGPDWDVAVGVDAAIRNTRPDHNLFVHPGRVALADAVAIPEDEGATQLELPCDSGMCFT